MSIFRRLFGREADKVEPSSLPVESKMPEFAGAGPWFNSEPLTPQILRGKVVLIDFWTYSCINCIRTLPHVNAWRESFSDRGLVIIGVHTPEFDFEKNPENVKNAISRFGIRYPVVMDNDYRLWNAYKNRYWPAHYFVDRRGNIRYHHFGEGGYGHSAAVIRALLSEGNTLDAGSVSGPTIADDAALDQIITPETYLGYDRVEYLGSPEPVAPDATRKYSVPRVPANNIFYLRGLWTVRAQFAESAETGSAIVYRVRAAKVNLVMEGPASGGRVEIFMDGKPLNPEAKGDDVTLEAGSAVAHIKEGRLYNLISTGGEYRERLVELRFLDSGIKAFAFSFS